MDRILLIAVVIIVIAVVVAVVAIIAAVIAAVITATFAEDDIDAEARRRDQVSARCNRPHDVLIVPEVDLELVLVANQLDSPIASSSIWSSSAEDGSSHWS